MTKRVLLADDDHDDAEVFKEALAHVCPSAEFSHVEHGQKLFQELKLSSEKPHIIFLDLNMPELSGWQCLAKLKNAPEYQNIPVVMYTTSSNPRDREIAQDLGAEGLIVKPSDYKILEQVLDIVICNINNNSLRSALNDAYLITRKS